MQSRHNTFPINTHFIAALSQVETVIHYLTIKGVTVYGVILRGCRPVIRIDYHKICEQRLISGQAYYVTFVNSIPGGFKQGVFLQGDVGSFGQNHCINVAKAIEVNVMLRKCADAVTRLFNLAAFAGLIIRENAGH